MDKMAANGNKNKNFEFRMSKKVAELTQVVHMLFTRNHEKEVEMEALKSAYEHEISLVLQDAQSRIQSLNQKIQDMEYEIQTTKQRIEQSANDDVIRREADLHNKIAELESQLHEEKTESQNSRDLLIQAQTDLGKFRQVHVEDCEKFKGLLKGKDKELEMIKNRITAMEQELRDKTHLLSTKSDLLRTHEKLRQELDQVQMTLQNVERTREELSAKNRHLENDVRTLRRELAKRANSAKSSVPIANGYTDYTEEIDDLKKELARYKMELSNRENNFNRMFMEKQPVHVNDREPRMRSLTSNYNRPRQGTAGLGTAREQTAMNLTRINREKQYSNEIFTDEQFRELSVTPKSSVPASRSHSFQSTESDRLPNLDRPAGHNAGLNAGPNGLNLVKPRLPRDLLGNKRQQHV